MMTTTCQPVKDYDQLPVMATCRVLEICRTTLAKYESLGYITSTVNQMGRKLYFGREIKRCYRAVRNS